MDNTIQLYVDKKKETKGYPITSPDRVIDENGVNIKDYVEDAINNAKLEGGNTQIDLSGYAKKTELHSHSNKTILDSITSEKVNQWDSKSDFSGNYNDLINKPTIPKASNYKTAYGTCSSTASTSEKVVVIDDPNWELEVGNIVTIMFSASNTASNVTLNINNTGAFPIWFNTSEYTGSSTTPCGAKNACNTYMFNGTHWAWLAKNNYSSYSQASLGQGYGVCTTAESTLTKTSTISSYSLAVGGVVSIKFTYGVPANSTLKIGSRAETPIFYRGLAITDGIIKAGDTATFIYNGSQYQLISLDSVIDGYVTPQMFGAKGNGAVDDTDAINQAIEYAGNNGIVFFPEGTYLVSSSMSSNLDESKRYVAIGIYQKENLKLLLSPKAHIKHRVLTEAELLSWETARYYIIGIINSKNIEVIGGKIEGESAEHIALYKNNANVFWWQADGTYSRGHGYGICVRGSKNIRIDGCEVYNCFGDSLHVSVNNNNELCEYVTIENCNLHDSTRQGISVTGGKFTTIRNCEIYNIVGNAPQSGIDFEPNYVEQMNINSLVENCYIHDCDGYMLINAKANKGAKILNCKLYGKVTATCDDTYPVEYINCDILSYQSSNAYRNILRNCRIATCGMYEAGDDFYDCTFDPDLFNHIIDGYGSTVNTLIEVGSPIISGSIANFNRCKFISTNSGGYASNFMMWRNNGVIDNVTFDNCNFLIGLHSYEGLNIKAKKDVKILRCNFETNVTSYKKQFIEITSANDFKLIDNIINVNAITSYTSSSNSILFVHGKNSYIEANQFIATSKLTTYPIKKDFVGNAGEIYCLRNSMPLWDNMGGYPTNATKLIYIGNIISTTKSQSDFTSEDREKLDNVSDLIADAGFITEIEAKDYVDLKISEVNAQGIQQTPLFANDINGCTDTSKVYVLPDGNIYGYVASISPGGTPLFKNWLPLAIDSDGSIFNGVGYKDGYRLNTAGAVIQDTSGTVSVTGFIPCKLGDIVRIKGATKGASNYISQYKSDFTKYGNQYYWTNLTEQSDGTFVFDTNAVGTFQTTTAYVRFSFGTFNNAIITVNEEIVYSESTTTYQWANTGHAFIPTDYESRILALEEKIKNLNL